MNLPKDSQWIIERTSHWVTWWIDQRQAKLRNHLTETMTINPFLLPIIYDFHHFDGIDDLFELTVGSHLMTGHNTGFGKLIDEKILPSVFGTEKLDARYRISNSPLEKACFDEIDHVVRREDGSVELLSLKAGRWTIQLSMAVQLNRAFQEIHETHGALYRDIVVGVFYGHDNTLTDKYAILRGINRGKNHSVQDLTHFVRVLTGKEFWSWLNYGDDLTQSWVMMGIQQALEASNVREENRRLLDSFKERLKLDFRQYTDTEGKIDWIRLLGNING